MIASLFICPEGGITVAKAKTPFEKAASKILERRGVSETQWKQEVLEKHNLTYYGEKTRT